MLWPGPKSEENLWKNIDDTSPKAKCGGDGTIESFIDDPTKSGTQHKRIILWLMILDDAVNVAKILDVNISDD